MKKYWIYFTVYWQSIFSYRFDTAVYALTGLITPVISLFVWLSILQSNNSLGFQKEEIIFYFLAAAWCGAVTTAWGAFFIGDEIKKGAINGYLLRPFSILENFAMNNLAEKAMKLIFLTTAIIGAWWIFSVYYTLSLPVRFELIPLTILALLEGALMMILIDVVIGLGAFWVDEIDFLINGFFMADSLLSGRIIPIAFLPHYLQAITPFLPFRYLVSFPIELIMGKLNISEILFGFVVLTSWLLVFRFLQLFIYKEGTKRLQSFGG